MTVKRLIAATAVAGAISALFISSATADPAETTSIASVQPVTEINTTAELTTVMKEATAAKKLTILALSSKQCGPCQQMRPKMLKAANDEAANTWVLALHEAPTLNHTELSKLYKLRGWPTYLATGGDTADPTKTCDQSGPGDFGGWAKKAVAKDSCKSLLGGG